MAVPHESDTCGPVVGKVVMDALGLRWTTMEPKWPLICAFIRMSVTLEKLTPYRRARRVGGRGSTAIRADASGPGGRRVRDADP